MAFNIKNVTGNIGAGGGVRFFTYGTSDDRATVETAGYFDDLYISCATGDVILVNASDSLFQVIVRDADTEAKTVTVVTTMSEGGL